MSNSATYFVVCTTSPWGNGRISAVRGLKFETEAAAKAHIPLLPAYLAQTAFVEERKDKSKDEAYQMHCQCCGRAIFAETGTIAHHGYTRPGDGWQTASCWGAKELPFEVSRDGLGRLINRLNDRLVEAVESKASVANGLVCVTHQYPVYDKRTGRSQPHFVTFTRDTFDAAVAENKDGWCSLRHGTANKSFDHFLTIDLNSRQSKIENQRRVLKDLQARYDGWKQTHKRVGKAWVRI